MTPEQNALEAQISAALIKADKMGNIEDAKALATELRRIRSYLPDPANQPPNPTDGMTTGELARAGVGKAMVDTARGAGQLVGAVSREDVAAARERDAALTHTLPGMLGDIGGNVAAVAAPGGILKGAGVLAKAGGAAEAGAALSRAGGVLLAPKTIPQAVGAGAFQGLLQPSTSTKETVANAALGAGGSAAVPVLVKGGQIVKAAAEPLYEGGQNQIMGRLLNRVAGKDAPAVAGRLTNPAELVPGSLPTVGQAAGNAGVASLERTATAIEPAAANAMADRLAQQNAARIAHIESVAGEPGKREMFDASRRAAADELYDAAYKAGIDLRRDAATGQMLSKAAQSARMGEITKLMNTPALKEASAKARELMANDPNLKGKLLDPSGSVQGLDYTRRALSDMIGKATGNEQRILQNLRDRLDTTINTVSPKYAEARATFAEMSSPINQMDIGQAMLDKGVNKVTGKLEAGKFINNLNDQTAAGATGFKKATLAGTLDPEQLAKMEAVKADLQRATAAQNAAGGPGSDTIKKLAYSNLIDTAGVPTFLRNLAPAQVAGNLAARGADALYGRANTEMASRLAQLMTNPQAAGEVMRLAQKPGSEGLLELLTRGGSAAGALAVPVAAPALNLRQ